VPLGAKHYILDALNSAKSDQPLEDLKVKISKLKSNFSQQEFARSKMPSGHVMTSDYRAIQGGFRIPPHISLEGMIVSKISYASQLTELGKLARQVVKYLQIKRKLKGISVAKTDGSIFIGHGRSPIWKDMRDFIRDDLELPFDEFNRDPTEGLSTKEVLQQKLDQACFALLVMTGEDERDGKLYARQNVVHEAGLFQGRLGFERAIILLEEGCEEFSNKVGITHISFPKGDVSAAFEKIRRVLRRERIIG
jgi:predicted nucleotide-binding protein